jgi:nucleolar protein 15
MVKELKKQKETKDNKEPKKRQLSRRFNKLKIKAGELDKKGIIYIGHLPKGFNEQELRKFFEQFGEISRLRVSRSSKVHNHIS